VPLCVELDVAILLGEFGRASLLQIGASRFQLSRLVEGFNGSADPRQDRSRVS